MEEKKKGKGLIVTIVILLLLIISLCGYIGYDKFLSDNKKCTTKENTKNEANAKNETEVTSEKEAESTNQVSDTLSSKYCEGTYTYDDNNLSSGNGELHKQVYTLKSDGTFTGSKNDITKEEGTYIIKDDTIVFIYHPETYGGPNRASYTSSSYYISEDCSYMSYEDHKTDGNTFTVKLTK